ncbi:hypothetical protein BD410DRAFT_896881 [Rickenella mellea]|uniref:Uncharacterized protein n=1 Tax=Rickenella mellea TaxID=50990 RepID=A0A4Y7Q931_9AGAM|nr:hypothetical protein BD410DRAFT_896881 [Rickenella mellea]
MSESIPQTGLSHPSSKPGDSSDKVKIFCLIRDESTPVWVEVLMSGQTTAIRDGLVTVSKATCIEGLPAHKVTAWKLNEPVPIDPVHTLADRVEAMWPNLPSFGSELPWTRVSDVFEAPPAIGFVHFLVPRPVNALKRKRSPSPVSRLLQLRLDHEAHYNIPAPSAAAEPETFRKLQKRSDNQPFAFFNRPHGTSSIPVTLLHPVFGQFVDAVETYEPTSADKAFVRALAIAMSDIYTNEGDRASAFRGIIADHWGIKLSAARSERTSFITDGHFDVGKFLTLLTEATNDIGAKGAEPFYQCVQYHAAAHRNLPNSLKIVPLPCLHIVCFGPCIGLAGSAMTDRVHMDVLAPIIPVFHHPEDTVLRHLAARYFGAFKQAVDTLVKYYQEIDLKTCPNPLFPFYTTYKAQANGEVRSFTYDTAIEAGGLVFLGSGQDGEKLVIKFVRTYSTDISGKWYMVVMDGVSGEYVGWNNLSRLVASDVTTRVHTEIITKISLLHDAKLVHGDIRDTNLLVRVKADAQEVSVMLVDYDWAGLEGEVYYPDYVNITSVVRPLDVKDGVLITKEHDLEMVDLMFPRPEMDLDS